MLLFTIFINYGLFFNASIVAGTGDLKPSATYDGISHYTTPQNVTYEVSVNFSLSNLGGSTFNYWMKHALFDDRVPSKALYTPPIQVSDILYYSVSGNDTVITSITDDYGNNYRKFDRQISQSNDNPIDIDIKYRITLSEIAFDATIPDSDIGSSIPEAFETLYCKSENFFDTSDADLIALSNQLCSGITNPVARARTIYDWIIENLVYEVQIKERGASWAYDNLKGDCSEYSDLMITLLRIQGIPARKSTGPIISSTSDLGAASPDYFPSIGDTFNFYSNVTRSSAAGAGTLDSNVLGHAWLEYYVDEIGWIPCDPTWGSSGYNYFNRIDFIHLTSNLGAWLTYPPSSPMSEFHTFPSPVYELDALFKYTTDIKIVVTGLNLSTWISPTTLMYIAIGIIGAICLIIYIVFKKTGKRSKPQHQSSNGNTYSY